MAKRLIRIDQLLCDRNIVENKMRAEGLLLSGKVSVNGTVVDKAGTQVDPQAQITVAGQSEYVGRGAYKLVAALDSFKINPSDKICVDVGSSTGGFTEVLLKRDAIKIYAIDSARGELDWKLRKDERVVVMEGKPVREIQQLPDQIELATVDVSLVSLRKILPEMSSWLAGSFELVALLKPQYEATREQLPPGAVIDDDDLLREIAVDFVDWLGDNGYSFQGITPSPIRGGSGNREFLVYCTDLSIAPRTLTLPEYWQP